jgi:hypothetical protein
MFLVPVHDNHGRLFRQEAWDALEDRLLATFGGFSMTPGIHGAWRAGDAVFRDVSRQYAVAITGWSQMPVWLDMIEDVRVAFGQLALYVEVAGIPEILAGGGD